jgi:hypothetical protein
MSDPGAPRKALDESNAIVDGFWTLSTFVDGDKAFPESLKRPPLRIIIPSRNRWIKIREILEGNDYQLRGNDRADMAI